MVPVSIVIITRNVADIIAGCIRMARRITDDIVVIVNDSSNEPIDTPNAGPCRVYRKAWDGYGANKNKGVEAARYNWILSIDADEIPDEKLIRSLHKLKYNNPAVVYDIKFQSYFGKQAIHFGSWGRDHHARLFNRKVVKWAETLVHETLILPENVRTKKIHGCLHHFSAKDLAEYDDKGVYYARLSAEKYFRAGIKANAVKLYISPVFGFLKNYIFCLGFLDGRAGWDIAKANIRHTYRKYHYLSLMENQDTKKHPVKDSLIVEY
ncbi:MAG: glycosyltransferase family 2 protein [Mucilaginibacter sp.]